MHDIEEMAQQRLTPQERREGPDDGPSRACRAEKLSILALGDDGYDQVTRETGPDIKPLICTTAFISKCKVLE